MLTNQKQGIASIVLSRFSDQLTLPSELANHLIDSGFSESVATAFVWGEDCELTSKQIRWLAERFNLNYDLLVALLVPTSSDIIQHILMKLVKEELYSETCSQCYQLEEIILATTDDLSLLALEVLNHLNPEAHQSEEDNTDLLDSSSPLVQSIAEIAEDLTPQQQTKLLTYACKLATEEQSEEIDYLETVQKIYAKLEGGVTCRVIDHLAVAEQGKMPSQTLIEILNLEDKSALTDVSRELTQICSQISNEGFNIATPLKTDVDKENYFLTAQFRQAWLAIMRANGHSLLAMEDEHYLAD